MGRPSASWARGTSSWCPAKWHEVRPAIASFLAAAGPREGLCRLWVFCSCRYYVKSVKKPKERAALSLAVRVGSAQEEEHERGIAHITEHLCAISWIADIMHACMHTLPRA